MFSAEWCRLSTVFDRRSIAMRATPVPAAGYVARPQAPPSPPACISRSPPELFPKSQNGHSRKRKTPFPAELVDLAVWADTHSITMRRCRMDWWSTYDNDYDDEELEVLIDYSE